jgi:hypothetical protein
MNLLVIILIAILVIIFFNQYSEHFGSNFSSNFDSNFGSNFGSNFHSCFLYGNDYDRCYANPSCTIGFLPNGSTHCMKKFLHEDI